ncbi:MAG: phosphoglucomutase, partial [Planctomycetaceae bacterium]|nr:phosphoglucomutase [Planctomycetaceae bacterium]
MSISPLAGKPAPKEILVNLDELEKKYYETKPDINNPQQLVTFGTSGHRGTSLDGSFTESHILAICQAICDYRKERGYTGILYLGKDTHYLSDFAQKTALEVFVANNNVYALYQQDNDFTPTPVISWWILTANGECYDYEPAREPADGVIITPSHNPPTDGGIKYNPPNGGPADTDVTTWIQNKANDYLRANLNGVKHLPLSLKGGVTYAGSYIKALGSIVDMKAIKKAKIRIGVDPLGGAGVHYWEPIAERYGLDITVVNKSVDPQFGFMCVDHDGKIRMDCSSPYAMHGLVAMKDKFDIAFANDP